MGDPFEEMPASDSASEPAPEAPSEPETPVEPPKEEPQEAPQEEVQEQPGDPLEEEQLPSIPEGVEGEDPGTAPQPSEETIPESPQTYKFGLKVDGEEKEVEFTKEEVVQALQLEKGSRQKFNEASKLRDSAAQVIASLNEKPVDAMMYAFMQKGMSQEQAWKHTVKLADQIVSHEIKLQEMPEADRNLIKERQETTRLRREVEDLKKTRQQRDYEETQVAQRDYLRKEINEVSKSVGLPVSEATVQNIAARMIVDPSDPEGKSYIVNAAQAAKELFKEVNEYRSNSMTALPMDELIEKHPDFVQKVNKASLERAKRLQQRPPENAPDLQVQEVEKPRITTVNDW